MRQSSVFLISAAMFACGVGIGYLFRDLRSEDMVSVVPISDAPSTELSEVRERRELVASGSFHLDRGDTATGGDDLREAAPVGEPSRMVRSESDSDVRRRIEELGVNGYLEERGIQWRASSGTDADDLIRMLPMLLRNEKERRAREEAEGALSSPVPLMDKELEARAVACQQNVPSLIELATRAEAQQNVLDAKRLYRYILRLEPGHQVASGRLESLAREP